MIGEGQPQCDPANALTERMVQPPALTDRVDREIAQTAAKLEALKEMKDLLEKNKDVERLLTLMGQHGVPHF